MRFSRFATIAGSLLATTPAIAQQDPDEVDPFGLGQIVVTAPALPDLAPSGSTLSSEAIYTFNRNSLGDAANLIPGVSASNTGGSRNDRLIFVRGFDRFQVPLSIDGIRVYLPADNRLDYGRFLTPDIAEIQVAKGYVSVLDGPGGLGGAVNLVTRRPTREFEAEARGTLSLDRDVDYAGYNVFGFAGTRQDDWYAQASYTRNFQDHWDLPGGFDPTETEDGGERDFSRTSDWRISARAGFTPNPTDEYSISYTRQEGSKNAPLHISNPLALQRFWRWPYWNIESIYFLSTTALGDRASLRTRAYLNSFDNLLRSFDGREQDSQTIGRAFNSFYEDEAYGGSAQLDVDLAPADTLRIAAHYRRDRHVEFQQGFPTGFIEPPQTNDEDTYSLSAENTFALSRALTLVLGASYDWRDLKRAEEFGVPPEGGEPRIFSYPIRDADAFNAQGQVIWTPDADTRLHASVSSRARFPTIFERFSSRFGGAVSNPDLDAERATNYEIGGARRFGILSAEGAVFYSRLSDVIVSFPFIFQGQPVSQSRNLGSGDYYGGEIALSAAIGPELSLGANYTYIHRDLEDPSNTAFQPTGVPTHKGFAFADWSPARGLHIIPSIDAASDRWTVTTDGASYFRTGAYIQASLRIDFEPIDGVRLGVGARNLFDDYYVLTDGFPEPGRSFFVSVRARY